MKKIATLLSALTLLTTCLFSQPCQSGESTVVVEILTDDWPLETAWELRDASSGAIYASVDYNTYEQFTLYTTEICIPEDLCTEFIIYDSYGDGIFLPGYYKIWVDGVEVATNSAFGSGDYFNFNCLPGTTCFDAIPITEGGYATVNDNAWYEFTADSTGTYLISTCYDSNICDTKIWIYDECNGLTISEDNTGTIFYNDNSSDCGNLAEIFGYIGAGQTFYIRIGDANDDCSGLNVTWSVYYYGPVIGCMDPASCNYNPLATLDDGSCLPQGDPNCPNGPDLLLRQDVLESSIYLTTLDATDACLVNEGCLTGLGTRDLIRFTTHIQNIGELDYFIGEPNNNPEQFTYDNCHGHYHYDGYAEYLLYETNGNVLPIGFKNGFCVLDLECSGGGTAQYGCSYMGISAGCGDIYDAYLDCQWVDVTTVADGDYILVTRVNWDNAPDGLGRIEKDTLNNWGQVCINLDRSSGALVMTVLEDCDPYVDCAGVIYGNSQPDCAGVCGGTTLMGDLNTNAVQEMVDAENYVNSIIGDNISATTCNDLNADGNITVYDAAMLSGCLNYGAVHTHSGGGFHNHCDFPGGILNIFDTTTLSIIGFDFDEKYIDIGLKNPTCRVVAYQFKVDGLLLTSVTNLMNPAMYPINVEASNTGMVIGLSYQDSLIAKAQEFVPLCRLYFSQITASEICLSEIIDIVNHDYQQTITRIADGCLMVVSVEEGGMVNNMRTTVEPNPFGDYTLLQFDNKQGNSFELSLTDVQGRVVRQYSDIRESIVKIERGELVSGVYWYRLSGKEGVGVGRFVVE
jgi:Lysyl oxidase